MKRGTSCSAAISATRCCSWRRWYSASGRPPLVGIARAAEIGRERIEVGEGDVGGDIDRVRAQQVAQERHLHGLALEVVDDELAHVAGADAVVDRIVEPVDSCAAGAASRVLPTPAMPNTVTAWRGALTKLVRRLEQHGGRAPASERHAFRAMAAGAHKRRPANSAASAGLYLPGSGAGRAARDRTKSSMKSMA